MIKESYTVKELIEITIQKRIDKMNKKKISYGVRGYAKNHATVGQRLPFIVWQYIGENPVNEYIGYDRDSHLTLYPKRRIVPSNIPLEKHEVNIRDTRSEFQS